MEPYDKKFFLFNDEQFSSIFNGNIPSLKIKIDISYEPGSPSQNTECLQDAPIQSERNNMEERPVADEDLKNAIMKTKRDLFESSPQNTDGLQSVPAESVPTIPRNRKMAVDDQVLKNALEKIKRKIIKSLPNNSGFLQEVRIGSEPDRMEERPVSDEDLKNAIMKDRREIIDSSPQNTDRLQAVPAESVPAIYRKRKMVVDDKVLKNALEKIKRKIIKVSAG